MDNCKLLQLPVELIQLILRTCNTEDYLQAALACHDLYTLASTRRDLVLHHLRRIPGAKAGLDQHSTESLFLLLRRRAAKYLLGAERYADRVLYGFGTQSMDLKASSMAPLGEPYIALVSRNDQRVHILSAKKPKESLMVLSLPEVDHGQRMTVVKTTFSGKDVMAVLARLAPSGDDDGPANKSSFRFARDAKNADPQVEYLVFFYDLARGTEPIAVHKFTDKTDWSPIAFAVADAIRWHNYDFAISWWKTENHEEHMVNLYHGELVEKQEDDNAIWLKCTEVISANEHSFYPERQDGVARALIYPAFKRLLEPVTRLAFSDNGRQLLYYTSNSTLHSFYQNLTQEYDSETDDVYFVTSEAHRNYTMARASSLGVTLLFSLAIPFFAGHDTYRDKDRGGRELCRWRYFTFATADQLYDGIAQQPVPPDLLPSRACVMMAESKVDANRCGHVVNLDRGRRLRNWTVVAYLAGYEPSTTSLGGITAATEDGTRFAFANWDTLYIWSMDPSELHRATQEEESDQDFYPASWREHTIGTAVVLEPVVFKLGAVCHKLTFRPGGNGDEILAVTDRGIMVLSLGPKGTAKREGKTLEL